ncbi:MAG: 2-dehydro-3-deoxygalactonokinase [Neomegalonema sp.]|nr:2-dehydro-3-deoxygalactonokinase [Neomegalonema sp.]
MSAEDTPIARAQSDQGMGALTSAGYEPALAAAAEPWLKNATEAAPMLVLISGMAGARQGWLEAPYAPVPGPPLDPAKFVAPPTQSPRLRVRIAHGLAQHNPPDVMRGEETQIAGFLAAFPDFEGVICLPGTHSKWAEIASGRVTQFHTAMTGEIFALFSEHSVLRHSLQGDSTVKSDSETLGDCFARAVHEAYEAPAASWLTLFRIRAQSLLAGVTAPEAREMLSGMLIGAEIAALRPVWQGRRLAVIGAPALTARYSDALTQVGAVNETFDVERATLAGLSTLRAVVH